MLHFQSIESDTTLARAHLCTFFFPSTLHFSSFLLPTAHYYSAIWELLLSADSSFDELWQLFCSQINKVVQCIVCVLLEGFEWLNSAAVFAKLSLTICVYRDLVEHHHHQ